MDSAVHSVALEYEFSCARVQERAPPGKAQARWQQGGDAVVGRLAPAGGSH